MIGYGKSCLTWGERNISTIIHILSISFYSLHERERGARGEREREKGEKGKEKG